MISDGVRSGALGGLPALEPASLPKSRTHVHFGLREGERRAHAGSSSRRRSSPGVHQMLLHERGGVPERLQLIGTLGEAVAFVGIDIVANVDPTLTQQLDNLIALPLDHPWIV